MEEYIVQCWNCALEFDALSAQWCGCSAVEPSKICPYCYTCMCSAPSKTKKAFWDSAPQQLLEEKTSFNQPRDRIGDLLVKQNLLTNDQLLIALKEQKKSDKKLGAVLIDLGYVDEETVSNTLSQQYGLMSVNLDKIEIEEDLIDDIGLDLIKKYNIIPVEKQELSNKKMITVAVTSPLSPTDVERLQKTVGYTIYPVLAQDSVFNQLFDKLIHQESAASKKAKYIQLAKAKINALIGDAIKRKASEIVFQLIEKELSIHYRIGGKLFTIQSPAMQLTPFIITRLKKLAKIEEVEEDSSLGTDGRFQVKTKNKTYELLLHVFPSPQGETITLTIIDEATYTQKINKLVLDPVTLRIITTLLHEKNGLIFLIGPVGSGKILTLYSLLNAIAEPNRKIISLENPIYVNIPDVIQNEVKTQKEQSFAQRIQVVMQDYPDVLAVTETSEADTTHQLFKIAPTLLEVALSDHLKPSELLLYLNGQGIKRQTLTLIKGIINQRMLPSICPHCRDEMVLEYDDLVNLGLTDTENPVGFRGKGCANCNNTGYLGYIPLIEIILFTRELRQQLLTNNTFEWIDHFPLPPKTRSIKKLVADLILKGWINVDDARTIDFKEDTPLRELTPLDDESSDGETQRISLE